MGLLWNIPSGLSSGFLVFTLAISTPQFSKPYAWLVLFSISSIKFCILTSKKKCNLSLLWTPRTVFLTWHFSYSNLYSDFQLFCPSLQTPPHYKHTDNFLFCLPLPPQNTKSPKKSKIVMLVIILLQFTVFCSSQSQRLFGKCNSPKWLPSKKTMS